MGHQTIEVCSDYSGVGAFNQALEYLSIPYKQQFVCDMDYFARISYVHNYGTENDIFLANLPCHKTYCNIHKKLIEPKVDKQSIFKLLKSVSIKNPNFEESIQEFLIQQNEFSKQFSFYFPMNVYHRDIPINPSVIYMTSPPCQAFSIAGKRKGKDDLRGILFFNSLDFIQKNKPQSFIFENVDGLLSDDNGKTFREWINFLGGKSVNGQPTIFPYDDSVPYHIYWKVVNAKDHNVLQNRKRVFIVGFREDEDNIFQFPKEEHLQLRLKDVLETNVDEKYFISQDLLNYFQSHKEIHKERGNGFKFEPTEVEKPAKAVSTQAGNRQTDNFIKVEKNIAKKGFLKQDTQGSQVFSEDGISPTISAGTHGYALGYVQTEDVEIGTFRTHKDGQGFRKIEDNVCPTIPARAREDGSGQPVIKIPSNTKKGYDLFTENDSLNISVPNSTTRRGRVGVGVAQILDTSCNQVVMDKKCIPVLTPDRVKKRQNGRRFKNDGDEMFTITNQDRHGVYDGFLIRRLTPRECFRLMDFPDTFKIVVSDSQAYKQAGNSIVRKPLAKIIANFKFLFK